MMSRAEATICIDIARAAFDDAIAAILRKTALLDHPDHRMIALQAALSMISAKAKALSATHPIAGFDMVFSIIDAKERADFAAVAQGSIRDFDGKFGAAGGGAR